MPGCMRCRRRVAILQLASGKQDSSFQQDTLFDRPVEASISSIRGILARDSSLRKWPWEEKLVRIFAKQHVEDASASCSSLHLCRRSTWWAF